ncbi:hypothetical protein AVEN_261162-1 [Araneus ventricosus]|uniref:Uncharacterized protein n=1 Tax=Araneus ventricosus TaxID=182803 RepID=A0A4Y2FNM5_ARAVE|nr:hypothetical protein AVEN_261162-1 [Araneus ventricosus]
MGNKKDSTDYFLLQYEIPHNAVRKFYTENITDEMHIKNGAIAKAIRLGIHDSSKPETVISVKNRPEGWISNLFKYPSFQLDFRLINAVGVGTCVWEGGDF